MPAEPVFPTVADVLEYLDFFAEDVRTLAGGDDEREHLRASVGRILETFSAIYQRLQGD
jgi:hypothetical protein